jgi:YadA-like C-terminal region.
MNTIFKVVWSASKQCYVVASELATNTSGKKKIMVATVLAALAMGSFLQVGAETTVTADQVNAINIETNYIKLDSRDIVTKLSSNEFSMIGDDISGIPWKTVLNPGLVAVETSEINTSISRHGFHMSDVDETSETYIEPKGITLGAKDGKILEFNLDKISAGGMKVQDIAEGTADTDAVNVKQLKDSISNIGNVKMSTLKVDANGKVTGESGLATSDNVATVINQVVEQNTSDTKELKQAISSVSSETQRVGAHAAAMAALKPIQYDPLEPTQVMAGVGNYRGETAAALGLAHYTNENTMLNVGVSLGGTHNMVNAGVTHKFGSSLEKKNIPDRYKGGPISSIYVMQDEMTRMQAKNDAQQVEIEQQRAEIESLKSMVQQLLAKH